MNEGFDRFLMLEMNGNLSYKSSLSIPLLSSFLTSLNVRFSDLYDERVEIYRQEKKKTEKLLTDLLPRQVIRQMKQVSVRSKRVCDF